MMKSAKLIALIVIFGVGMITYAFRSSDGSQAKIVNGEKHIVVVIPSYNNSKWYDKNLGTLFAQKYDNYRVIYIVDGVDSEGADNTYDLVKDFVHNAGQEHRFTLIRNSERKGALHNLYEAIHSCPDNAIICTIDGDDWLPFGKTDVFSIINKTYDNPNVWLTYGQFETYNGPGRPAALGICHPMSSDIVKAKSYRKEDWFVSHMRTFYAGLFKRVKCDDLKLGGQFYSVAWDQAFLFPMLEMANGHIQFIEDIIYIYNQVNPLNDFRQRLRQQLTCERIIRRKTPYSPLDSNIIQPLFIQS